MAYSAEKADSQATRRNPCWASFSLLDFDILAIYLQFDTYVTIRSCVYVDLWGACLELQVLDH
jgi:hypothetical protein